MPVCHNHNCRKSGDASCDLKNCESCGMATYCSKKYQKNHLSVHKKSCKILKIGIFRDCGDKKLRFNVGGELFVRSIHNYRLIYVRVLNELFLVSPLHLTTHHTDRVRCSVGEWMPWAHGTIVSVGGPGDAVYGICCDDGTFLVAPKDKEDIIQELSTATTKGETDQAAQLHDEALFEKPPVDGDCPICMQRLPMKNLTTMTDCCGQEFCCGCDLACRRAPCPFCREMPSSSDEVKVQRTKKRMELGDADAYRLLGIYYDLGIGGLQQDSKKAFELWTKAAELGSRNAHYTLAQVFKGEFYTAGVERDLNKAILRFSSEFYTKAGVERDMKKAIYHLEICAIKGDGGSRCDLMKYESALGNLDRAKKHGMLSAGMGCDSCMDWLKTGYVKGCVTEEEYSDTVRSHRESIDEMKNTQRDAAGLLQNMLG